MIYLILIHTTLLHIHLCRMWLKAGIKSFRIPVDYSAQCKVSRVSALSGTKGLRGALEDRYRNFGRPAYGIHFGVDMGKGVEWMHICRCEESLNYIFNGYYFLL